MTPRLWQRQPDEAPADFSAFVAYLRLKGRRSLRAVAARTGRSLNALRRLSARFHWSARVQAFETRLADATQDAVDSVLRQQPAAHKADLEQLRIKEFLLAHQVIHESKAWLHQASNPRRRLLPLSQIIRLTELAFKLARLACGMPLDESKTRSRPEPPGYWTHPSMEEALRKVYGSDRPAPVPKPATASPVPATVAPPPTGPPPDTKRDITPVKLVIGPHGLLTYEYPTPASGS